VDKKEKRENKKEGFIPAAQALIHTPLGIPLNNQKYKR